MVIRTRAWLTSIVGAVVLPGLWTSGSPMDAAGEGTRASAAATAVAHRQTPTIIVWGADQATRYYTVPEQVDHDAIAGVAAGGDHSLAVNRAGTVLAWGQTSAATDVPPELDDVAVTQVAAGHAHSLALTETGGVVAWGADNAGQTDLPASLDSANVIQIAAHGDHSLALLETGEVVAWGANDFGQSEVPASLNGVTVTQIAAGDAHSLAVTDAGVVVAWGDDRWGQSDVPTSLEDRTVTHVAGGGRFSLALTARGKVVAWGSNSHGQIDVPRSVRRAVVTDIAAGWHSLALTEAGRVVMWGGEPQDAVPTALLLAPVTQIAAGPRQSLAITRYRGPDLWIGNFSWGCRPRQGPWAGNNAYDTRSDPDLGGRLDAYTCVTDTMEARARIYNNSPVVHSFRVRGEDLDARDRGELRYLVGTHDRTRALQSRRGVTFTIQPDEYRTVRIRVDLPDRDERSSADVTMSTNWIGRPQRSDRAYVNFWYQFD